MRTKIIHSGMTSIFTSRNIVYLASASHHNEDLSIYVWTTQNTFQKIQTLKIEKLEELQEKRPKISSSFANEMISMPILY